MTSPLRLFLTAALALPRCLGMHAVAPARLTSPCSAPRRSQCFATRSALRLVMAVPGGNMPSAQPAAGGVEAPDPEIKCAFFRVIKPSSDSFKQFIADVDREGLDATLATVFAWPMVALQRGFLRSVFADAGPDIYNLDGIIDGILSHRDLMWPYRAEVADLLRAKSDADGMIHVSAIYEAKVFTAQKYGMDVSFGSYNEVDLIFLRCGGNTATGLVRLEDVLLFFDGRQPKNFGRIGFDTMKAAAVHRPAVPKAPTPYEANRSRVQTGLWYILTALTALSQLPNLIKALFRK